MLIWMAACGQDDGDRDPEILKLIGLSISEGHQIPGNAAISATFNKALAWAEMTVTGAPGTTTVAFKIATWVPKGEMSPGPHALTVKAQSTDGQMLEALDPINFVATRV
jgi:hypothetical protein